MDVTSCNVLVFCTLQVAASRVKHEGCWLPKSRSHPANSMLCMISYRKDGQCLEHAHITIAYTLQQSPQTHAKCGTGHLSQLSKFRSFGHHEVDAFLCAVGDCDRRV